MIANANTPPKSLNRINKYLIKLSWPDGFEAVIALEKMRNECPCAKCKGESVMGQVVYSGMKTIKPGMNELIGLKPMGNYGLEALWRDGHSSGIYTWENLRHIAEQFALDKESQDIYLAEDKSPKND